MSMSHGWTNEYLSVAAVVLVVTLLAPAAVTGLEGPPAATAKGGKGDRERWKGIRFGPLSSFNIEASVSLGLEGIGMNGTA